MLDYNVEFKTPNQVNTFYSPEPYRSSDHDPVVIGIQLAAATPQSVCELAEEYVASAGVASSLCAKLASGAYKAFANEVDAQTGKRLTAGQAAILKQLVARL